jgi:hypothetical protein
MGLDISDAANRITKVTKRVVSTARFDGYWGIQRMAERLSLTRNAQAHMPASFTWRTPLLRPTVGA